MNRLAPLPLVFFSILSVITTTTVGTTQEPKSQTQVPVRVRYNVRYDASDNSPRIADIYSLPHTEKRPAIVMIHGGAWIAGDKSYDAVHARKFAAAGYVVMVINYRLAPTHKFPAQIDDCFQALDWLSQHADEYFVDTQRIGVWGYSAGGHLAALVATNPRENMPRVRACVAGGAPCDLTLIPDDSQLLGPFLGGSRAECPDLYRDASPVTHVSEDDPPMFLFHGAADRLVPIAFAESMRDKLKDCKVEFEYLEIPHKTHIMAFVDGSAIEQSIRFFNEHLGVASDHTKEP